MKRLHFQIPNNLSLLHDELLAAIPGLGPAPNTLGILDSDTEQVELEPVIAVEGDGSNVWLTVPDDADQAAIRAVVLAHDPNSPRIDQTTQRRTKIEELLAIGRSNWTAAQRNELLELVARNS